MDMGIVGDLRNDRRKLQRRRDRIDELEDELEAESRELRKRLDSKRERDPKDEERAEQLADQKESLRSERQAIQERLDELDARDGKLIAKLKVNGRRIRKALKRKEEREGRPSKNFTYAEFNCRQGGPVPSYMYPHLDDLCAKFLERMRNKFGGCFVTSGHRWDWYDAMIGGVGGYHVYEKYRSQPAADCIFEKGTPAQWAEEARAIADELGLGGVGQYDRSGFVHIDTGPRRNWWG
jgi:hypothetical protein